MKPKIIPFDLETAKKIQAGEIAGKIVRNGCEVVILDYNSKRYLDYPIRIVYLDNDEVDYVTSEGLHIEVPDNDPQFKPFDKVLVRHYNVSIWQPAFFREFFDDLSKTPYYTIDGNKWEQCIPYEGNEHLVGTTNNPKEL